MEKKLFEMKQRVANIEKFVLFAVLLIATYLHIVSDKFEEILSYLPEGKAQAFYSYFMLFVFLISFAFLMGYLSAVVLTVAEEWSITFRNYVTKIYDKTKPVWKYSWLFFILIGVPIADYILPLTLYEMVGYIILAVIGAIIFDFIKDRSKKRKYGEKKK